MLKQRDPRHGTPGGYKHHGCRCKKCTAAWAEWHAEYMAAHPMQQELSRQRSAARRAGVSLKVYQRRIGWDPELWEAERRREERNARRRAARAAAKVSA